jgi:C1A family cysteine protease
MDVSEVRSAIQAAGADWEAADTPVARIVGRGDANVFGLAMDDSERSAALEQAAELERATGLLASVGPPPPAADWREGGHVTAVRDQGSCLSCVAFATCAAIEARIRILTGATEETIDLAEAHLFHCGHRGGCGKGWNPVEALERATTVGIGAEAGFPYQPSDQACQDIPAVVQVLGWTATTTVEARKQSIATNGPVIAGMRAYEDLPFYTGKIYKHVTGSDWQGHAVCVVGYSDADGCWIVKNSWGEGWGEGGYLRIAYGECGIDSEYPFWDPDVTLLEGG